MRSLRLGTAVVVLAVLAAAGTAHGAPPALLHGQELSQPTALGEETLVGAVQTVGRRSRFSVLSLRGAGAPARRVFSADVTPGGDEQLAHARRLAYAASATHLALLEDAESVSPLDVEAARVAVGFGPRAGLPRLDAVLDCEAQGGLADPPAYAVDGARVAVLTEHCGPLRLLVHEAGATRTLPVPSDAYPRQLELAGPYVAYTFSGSAARTVVARADTGEEVFAVDGRADGFALMPDGTLFVATTQHVIDKYRTCMSGVLRVASPAQPAAREVPGAQPCDAIDLSGDRVVFRDPAGVLRAVTPAGESTALATRISQTVPFDAGGDRVAILVPSCPGHTLYSLAIDGSSGDLATSGRCSARLLTRTLRLRGRTARARFACPNGCTGYVELRLPGRRRIAGYATWFAPPGRRATAPIRLSRALARSVRARGRRAARLDVHLRLPGDDFVSRTLRVTLRA